MGTREATLLSREFSPNGVSALVVAVVRRLKHIIRPCLFKIKMYGSIHI